MVRSNRRGKDSPPAPVRSQIRSQASEREPQRLDEIKGLIIRGLSCETGREGVNL